MKVLIEIKAKAKNGDILVFDEKENVFKPVSLQTFCHGIYEDLENTNQRIENVKNALQTINEQINKLANAIKEGF